MKKFKDSSKGFTLIELVGVIVIAGALTATAGNLLSTDVFDERWVFEDTLSAARYAQKVAMARGCAVQFSIGHTSFELKRDVNCRKDGAALFTENVVDPFVSSSSEFPPGIVVSAATIIFYPQGWACSADGGEYSTISILFVGASSRTLNIECGTGFVYRS